MLYLLFESILQLRSHNCFHLSKPTIDLSMYSNSLALFLKEKVYLIVVQYFHYGEIFLCFCFRYLVQ